MVGYHCGRSPRGHKLIQEKRGGSSRGGIAGERMNWIIKIYYYRRSRGEEDLWIVRKVSESGGEERAIYAVGHN